MNDEYHCKMRLIEKIWVFNIQTVLSQDLSSSYLIWMKSNNGNPLPVLYASL